MTLLELLSCLASTNLLSKLTFFFIAISRSSTEARFTLMIIDSDASTDVIDINLFSKLKQKKIAFVFKKSGKKVYPATKIR